MVGDTGIEPVTFPVSGGRSPAELIAHPIQASIPHSRGLQVSHIACVLWCTDHAPMERNGLTGA